MTKRFNDRVVVVTGGSTGIGLATASAFLNEGASRVYVTGRTPKSLDAALKVLGERAVPVVSDVSKVGDIEKLKAEIEERGDNVDVLFANAGIAEKNSFGMTTEAEFDKTFDINVKGLFFTVQTLLPLVPDAGAIVLNASIVANKGMAQLSLYNASKAAVRSLARTLANDLKERKIRVNAISPGFTLTPIMENGLKMDEQQIAALHSHAEQVVPLGYIAQPEEIATAVTFLASADASYVNGIELSVDGGMSQI